MSDEHFGDQDHGAAVDPAETEAAPPGASAVARPVRRPRPAPSSSYVPGRRPRAEEGRGINPILVPTFAVIALLALIAAIVFDHFHNTAASPAATPTMTPLPTPAPTSTPVVLPVPPTTKTGVAAEVNGEVVSMDVFSALFKVDTQRIQQPQTDPNTGATTPGVDLSTATGRKALFQQVNNDLRSLVDAAIIDAYAKPLKLAATKADVDKQFNADAASYGGVITFTQKLASQGYTMAVVRQLISDQITGQNVGNAVVKGATCPCDLHIRQILLKVKDQALANTLAKELQANKGKTFADLAKKDSTDTATKSVGGDMGFVSKGTVGTEFDKAAWALKIGQVSDPVKAADGWHIIQVLGSQPSTASKQVYYTKWLDGQRSKAKIHIYVQVPKA